MKDLPLFPPQASEAAGRVDAIFLFLCGLTVVMAILIWSALAWFAVRYRRNSRADRSGAVDGSHTLELLWSGIPLVIVMGIFVWGASIYVHLNRPPKDAMDIFVVGKRWMWKLQHLNGRREINELHVPVGRAVKLTMTSEDVIHSFYVPAFRIKMDVLPGRYTNAWFTATRPGRYHLFCTEYCGTKHSQMIGWVEVMEPAAYQAWMAGQSAESSPAAAGERLFSSMGCITCHNPQSGGRGPSLEGVFGSKVKLTGGGEIVADEAYLRESIVDPRARQVEGYEALMPTYRGLIGEEGLMQLIEYLKSRKGKS